MLSSIVSASNFRKKRGGLSGQLNVLDARGGFCKYLAFSRQEFSQKTSLHMFDRVLNTTHKSHKSLLKYPRLSKQVFLL